MPDEVGQVIRPTEGSRTGALARGKGGRPKGSKNKPKGIMPTELANEILLRLDGVLPEEQKRYLRSVYREGATLDIKKELQVLIMLLARNLHPALILEGMSNVPTSPDSDGEDSESAVEGPTFRKDVTERLKVLNSLYGLLNQVEKNEKPDSDDNTLVTLTAGRGIDRNQLEILVGVKSSAVVGATDDAGRPSHEARVVSDIVPERLLALPGGGEG